ncbi:hypothetical protein A2115_03265 [Candidatus Woesebacteria bacterium GWA1_41_8]|jgi:hypothetical protein|uniref:DUF3048 domain-containing protein n=1 Tax=Candidatus Woesebacteria bacterium GWA1_41_8 TaxID=1802471 RepID=A0A1F7WHS3_9BACT|nr:MAG: hypothetical protein A2115_03265 [Candidatus Woesebacteria bacterium GWA1_41_8]
MNKLKNFLSSKSFMVLVTFIGLYMLSSGASWAIFSYLRGNPSISITPEGISGARSKIDESLPKTESCPANGKLFTEPERAIWETHRPIAAVIENHLEARPQSGLSKADLIYEVVAEGGITRFLSVFYCGVAASDVRIGPIRSARIYLINWATEYGTPLFVHVGGANNVCNNCFGGVKAPGTVAKQVLALEELIKLGWRSATGNDLDAGANVGYPAVWRDPERIPGVAYEHTYMGSTDKLYQVGVDRGFAYKDENGDPWSKDLYEWKFVDEKPLATPKASDITFEFWQNQSDYDVEWQYDKTNNSYTRFNGGKPHIDLDTKEQLTAKNVLVQFVKEQGPVDSEKHMFYTTIGSGDIILFQNGDVVNGTWEKASQAERTKFYDSTGSEIKFVRGVIWIEAVPSGNDVNY